MLQNRFTPRTGSPTLTMLRLHCSYPSRCEMFYFKTKKPSEKGYSLNKTFFEPNKFPQCDGQGVQGSGTNSPWRADPRLLAIPSSCSRVAENNPNLTIF